MCHAYRELCSVTADVEGHPISFVWRDQDYQVEQVVAHWLLADRWWVSAEELLLDGKGPSVRHYFRVQCPGLAYYELYYDAAVNEWVLDRVIG
jgi:hypothetical protein